MMLRLLQYQRGADSALTALYAVGADVNRLDYDLEDPRSRKILQDFADFDACHGGVVAGLHALPEGYIRIQGTCRWCRIVGHKNADCDVPASAEKQQVEHYSRW